MKTIHYYQTHNNQGQELLDHYILPLANRLGFILKVINSDRVTNRGHLLISSIQADWILLDLSIEEGHCYGTLTETVKQSQKVMILSRTTLPRNVFVPGRMCAPIHGHSLSNAEIGQWVENTFETIAYKKDGSVYPTTNLYLPKWATARPGNIFFSFRGPYETQAKQWAVQYQTTTNEVVRMVAEGEYSYPSECMTAQQLWEGVAKLGWEMDRCPKVMINYTPDYFDSFWTSSELLWLLLHRSNNNKVRETWLQFEGNIQPLTVGNNGILPVPLLNAVERSALKPVIVNSDPHTAAPETQIPAQGLGKLIKAVLKPTLGYYRDEFTRQEWWKILRVPCPHCKPTLRQASQVEWIKHIQNHLTSYNAVDYFGYFLVHTESLIQGSLKCPQCLNTIALENKRPSRYLWMPIQSTERDKERSMFVENKVWEVVR